MQFVRLVHKSIEEQISDDKALIKLKLLHSGGTVEDCCKSCDSVSALIADKMNLNSEKTIQNIVPQTVWHMGASFQKTLNRCQRL